MDINLTLVGQMITFAIFVVFTMKVVWPRLKHALDVRAEKIAEGLAAGDKATEELEAAGIEASRIISEAKDKAAHVIQDANGRADQIIDASRETAKVEGDRILGLAKTQIEQDVIQAKNALRTQLADLAVVGAEKIIGKHVDVELHRALLNKLAEEL